MSVSIKTARGQIQLPAGFRHYENNSSIYRTYFIDGVLRHSFDMELMTWKTAFLEEWTSIFAFYDNGRRVGHSCPPSIHLTTRPSDTSVNPLVRVIKMAMEDLPDGQTAFLYVNRLAGTTVPVEPGYSLLRNEQFGSWELLGVIEKT